MTNTISPYLEMHQRWHTAIRKLRQAHDWDNLLHLIIGMNHPFYLVKYLEDQKNDSYVDDNLFNAIKTKHKKYLLQIKRILAICEQKSDEELFHLYKDFEVISGELIELLINFDQQLKSKSFRKAVKY